MLQPQFVPGHYYHIFNRGVNRGTVFFGRDNYGFFITRLRQYFTPDSATVIAYCLMPTHYHLLVEVACDDFGSRVMQPLGTSYTKAVNLQQGRVGSLFQGTFKAKLIRDDVYLRHVSRYIHLNPKTAGLVDRAEEWPFSSYPEYLGLRSGNLPRTRDVLQHFITRVRYKEYVESREEDDAGSMSAWFAAIA